ncbi:MAG: histidine phosphatase family protein [Planctomycetia bacterium]|nr:histidine phosphatase family protein [Planctomycetia bacterium]
MADSLVVIRAGTTDYDLQGRIRGTLDMPLAAEGVAEARALATRLAASPIDALYVAPDRASLETARHALGGLGLRPRQLDDLANFDQGLWQGMLVDDIRVKQPRVYRQWQDNPWAVSPPDGELLEEACSRVESALAALRRRHPRGRIAVVVPAPLDQVVRWLTAGAAIDDLWSRGPAESAVVEVPLAAQWRPAARLQRARA